ncbi:hypothetical protein [Synechococcus sp. R3-13]|uniref:hypothetical protein n=1 Tax=Synechococcus sp. R3-13 TaxID=2421316 RepID=UPI0039C043B4
MVKSVHPRRPALELPTGFWIPLVGGALVLLLLATWLQCLVVVPAGTRAVVFNSLTGLKPQPLGERMP